MPFWYIASFILALLGFFASWSGDLVLISSIYSFGLLLPVWYVAANLWWIMILCAPSVWLARHKKPLLGIVTSLGLFIGLVTAATLWIGQQRDSITPPAVLPPPGLAVAEAVPRSVEIIDQRRSPESGQRACDAACERLLTGPDVAWVRISRQRPDQEGADSLIWYRAEAADCLALDDNFPADAPCLLVRSDDQPRADLSLALTQTGDGFKALSGNHGPVYLTGIQSATLTDQRGPARRILDKRLRYFWTEPSLAPLIPAMTALGSGRKADGPHYDSHRAQSAPLDPAEILTHAGLTLGPARGMVTPPASSREPARPLPMPHDTALLRSLLAVADRQHLTIEQSQMVSDWLLQFDTGRAATDPARTPNATERLMLQDMDKLGSIGPLNGTLESMMRRQPELFVADVHELFQTIVTGTNVKSYRAVEAVSFMLFHAPVGTYDASWADYVVALKSGRGGDNFLARIGKFSMDPMPVLRDLAAHPPNDRLAGQVYSAACYVDPRQWPAFAPFLSELALGQVPKPGDTEFRFTELAAAVRGLARMQRTDLAQEVLGRIDWSIVAALPEYKRRPDAAERQRTLMEASVAKDSHC